MRKNTLKSTVLTALISSLLLIPGSVHAAAVNYVLDPSSSSVTVGSEFTVTMNLNGTNMAGQVAQVDYDRTKLQYLSNDASGTAFPELINDTPTSGRFYITRVTSGGTQHSGTKLITKIKFKALSSGNTNIVAKGSAYYNGTVSTADSGTSTITISNSGGQSNTPPPPPPETTTPSNPVTGGGTTNNTQEPSGGTQGGGSNNGSTGTETKKVTKKIVNEDGTITEIVVEEPVGELPELGPIDEEALAAAVNAQKPNGFTAKLPLIAGASVGAIVVLSTAVFFIKRRLAINSLAATHGYGFAPVEPPIAPEVPIMPVDQYIQPQPDQQIQPTQMPMSMPEPPPAPAPELAMEPIPMPEPQQVPADPYRNQVIQPTQPVAPQQPFQQPPPQVIQPNQPVTPPNNELQ